jgi:gas vesicle protein
LQGIALQQLKFAVEIPGRSARQSLATVPLEWCSNRGVSNKTSTHAARRYASLELIMDTWKFWMAFGVGVAAGAAVALLYAPQPGDRTRKQIKRGLEDASDQIKTTAEDFSEKAEQYGKQAERVIRRGREVVDDTLSKAGSVASKVSGFI